MSTDTQDWSFRLTEIGDAGEIEPIWLGLQSRAEHSFFQSWAWVGSWLRSLSADAQPLLLEGRRGDRAVALAILGQHTFRRQLVFTSRALLVNESGIPEVDNVMIEHNGLLIERGIEKEILERLVEFLVRDSSGWNELRVSGIDEKQIEAYVESSKSKGLIPFLHASRPYFYVDLAYLRRQNVSYLSTLSANTRYQIRRSMRRYQERGDIRIRVADSVSVAREYFDRLRELHQSTWTERGHAGAFASDFSNAFHERLIGDRFEHGEIQLVRVETGGSCFGYLYNFICDGMVSNYQSGFLYERDAHLKPGLVSHALAIEHNLDAGNRGYDFLAGDQRFKRSLSSHEGQMAWLVFQRQGFLPRLESRLRQLRGD